MSKLNRNQHTPITIEEMASDIAVVAAKNGLDPQELSEPNYYKLGGKFRSKATWTRKGGFGKIRSTLLPDTDKDLKSISSLGKTASYINKLEKTVGNRLNIEEMVKEVISGLKVKIQPKKLQVSNKELKDKVQMVAMLNDVHYGMVVDSEENGGLNGYNWKEAGRRTALFIKEICNYKPHKRKQVEKLHLVLNGDIIEGVLRGGQGNDQHLLTHQMNGSIHILTHAIEYLRKDFNKIDIHCLAGNHDRMVHKNQGHRPTSEVFDSYANIIYYSLSTIFKADKNVNFFIPKTPYGFVDLPAGRLMYLHGDGLWNKQIGNPGKSVNIGSISSAIREFNAGEIGKGNKPVSMVLIGHTHGHTSFQTTDGVEVCIAPSLCGINGYAHMLNINHNLIAQVVFESTKDFIFGDSRLIRLNKADNDKTLDNVIPEYKKELKV